MIDWLCSTEFFNLYAKDMRGGMFSGFLTIGGFLYSAHTFIVVHMKKEVYESDRHRKMIEDARKVNPKLRYYTGLRNLSRILITSVALALFTSLSQFTIGLYHKNWAALFCVSFAVATLLFLALSVFLMAKNLRVWFEIAEDEKAGPTV